jgi:cytochrome oxidase Cu insertion factor (SCO1/SenC/PrrC family)
MRRKIALLWLLILAFALPQGGNQLWAQNDKDKKEAPAAPPAPSLKVGDEAPDFTLLDTNRKQVSLKDFRGKKNVALAFYIFAFTGG